MHLTLGYRFVKKRELFKASKKYSGHPLGRTIFYYCEKILGRGKSFFTAVSEILMYLGLGGGACCRGSLVRKKGPKMLCHRLWIGIPLRNSVSVNPPSPLKILTCAYLRCTASNDYKKGHYCSAKKKLFF